MRINQFLAQATGISRREADRIIESGHVKVNNQPAQLGQTIQATDQVTLDNKPINLTSSIIILFHKPVGYVCSRNGQGSKTIYDLLPPELHHLKPVGRLDKDSSGLLLLTNDGELANKLTHPRYQKEKVYQIEIDRPLTNDHFKLITQTGVDIGDSQLSRFELVASSKQKAVSHASKTHHITPHNTHWQAKLTEGRNRQIRRTFATLGYKVTRLHRTQFGPYQLKNVPPGAYHPLVD